MSARVIAKLNELIQLQRLGEQKTQIPEQYKYFKANGGGTVLDFGIRDYEECQLLTGVISHVNGNNSQVWIVKTSLPTRYLWFYEVPAASATNLYQIDLKGCTVIMTNKEVVGYSLVGAAYVDLMFKSRTKL